MNKFEEFLNNTLTALRCTRDSLFVAYGIDKDTTYKNGTFSDLPTELLMKVCYVDAYSSVLANYVDCCKKEDASKSGKDVSCT